MNLPKHKTKIICTVGPACRDILTLKTLVNAGMNIARLNFSHGSYQEHGENIANIRQVANGMNRLVTILIDLPGTKMRVGRLHREPIQLKKDELITLTTRHGISSNTIIPIDFKGLAKNAKKGSLIYLNDGFIQLIVERIKDQDVICRVMVSGELRSHKGLNFPGVKLQVNAVTKRDLEYVDFGLKQGVYVFGVSFVERAKDIERVREFARKRGKNVYLIAKIERREAITNFDEILKVSDAVMIARGDLGVEIPTEEVPIIQKKLIQRAAAAARPVIIATQMLESMTEHIRPTRAEVTDVANAILDGADAVMLSEETALGLYPLEAVTMMAKIAAMTEKERETGGLSNDQGQQVRQQVNLQPLSITDVLSLNAVRCAHEVNASYILTPTFSGGTARRISRFKPHSWVIAFSTHVEVHRFLAFSYGVYPFLISPQQKKLSFITAKMKQCKLVKKGDTLVVTERRLSAHPGETDSLAIITL